MIFIDKQNKEVIIMGTDFENILRASRIAIRDAMYLSFIENGWVELRASACAYGSKKVILFLGESNSGKTTLLIKSLKERGTFFVANGRVFIRSVDNELKILGTPESIAIREPTCQLYDDFKHFEKIFKKTHNKRIKLSLIEFCRHLKTKIITDGTVLDVVIAQLEKEKTKKELECFDIKEYIKTADIYGINRIKERYWLGLFSYNENQYLENIKIIMNALNKKCTKIAYRYKQDIFFYTI